MSLGLINHNWLIHQANNYVGVEYRSFETTLLEPANTQSRETSPLLMDLEMAGHIVTKASQDSTDTAVKIDSDDT